MKAPSSRQLFLAGLALLVVTNAVVLGGVRYNRSGSPDTLITLSERELELPFWRHKENSGLNLHLDWRSLARQESDESSSRWGSPAWFTRDKLLELGFSADQLNDDENDKGTRSKALPKSVFIVLELDGPTYQEALRRAERKVAQEEAREVKDDQEIKWARERLTEERLSHSRLFAIDAGRDPKQLRQRYADRDRYLIAAGQVRPSWHYNDKVRGTYGTISELSVKEIHVPLSQRQIFADLLNKEGQFSSDEKGPRYQVVLAYGKRYEPWLKTVSALADQAPAPSAP